MAINKKNDICEYALNSLNDVISFARFVSYAEDLPQLNELFEDEHNRDNYQKIWFELGKVRISRSFLPKLTR